MESNFGVSLEVGAEATGAFVPDCPGCWVFGRTVESALEKVKSAIAEWFHWLKMHGEDAPDIYKENVNVEVRELLRVDYNPAEAGKPEPLFWSEIRRVGEEEIERTIRLMEYSRKDLMELIRDLPNEWLDWKPPGKPRTIRNCLQHIALVEPWYITRLNIEVEWDYPEELSELLSQTRSLVVERLQNLPKRKMQEVIQPRRHKSPVCNLWTARKVLRRLVDHERLHTKYIEKLLTRLKNTLGPG